MSTPQKVAWGTILSALALAGTIASFIARGHAEAAVAPVREDVAAMKAQKVDQDRRLERIESKLDRALERQCQ